MPDTADTEVHELNDEEVQVLAEQALNEAGLTLEQMRAQAELGRFDSETARHAWFVLKGLGCT